MQKIGQEVIEKTAVKLGKALVGVLLLAIIFYTITFAIAAVIILRLLY